MFLKGVGYNFIVFLAKAKSTLRLGMKNRYFDYRDRNLSWQIRRQV
jgi:hypothetical protein